MKRYTARYSAAIAALLFVLVAGCGAKPPQSEPHIDINDPLSGEGILTAEELVAFFEEGVSNTLTLAASVSIGEEMLCIDSERGSITINGNGFSISGNGDSVIRLDDGCSLILNDVTVTGGAAAIGCLGDATISGQGTVNSVAHGVHAKGAVTVGEDSRLYIKSNVGSAVVASSLIIGRGARLLASGSLGAVNVAAGDISLMEGATLNASTAENYNALKCGGDLTMLDGSELIVLNEGDYHGAEISELIIDGLVTIDAVGGAKGVGLFLFELNEEYYVLGKCEPELRFEVGDGSIAFVADASEIPEPTPEATDEAEAEGEGG